MKKEFVAGILQTCDQATQKVKHCLGQLTEEQIWFRSEQQQNSIGNLVLHVTGNLRQWGIVPFSGSEDLRDREREFSQRQPLKAEQLLSPLEQTLAEGAKIWSGLSETELEQGYSIQGFEVTGCFAILHTVTHYVGHTHQIITLTRQQLGSNYRFHWTPDKPRTDVPI